MTMYDFTNGNALTEAQLDEMYARWMDNIIIQKIEMLEDRAITQSKGLNAVFADAYTSSTGRQGSVDVSKTNMVFDTDHYISGSSGDPFVIIEATSISAESDFSINDCKLINVSSGKWQLSCTAGTNEERRAKIIKTLFYGTNGTDPRASSTYITGITALKTSVSRDVGKQAHYAAVTYNNNAGVGTYDGVFANTTTNTDCSSWSNVDKVSATSDEIGTDTSADETDNPANCQFDGTTVVSTEYMRWELPSGTTLNNVSDSFDNAMNAQAIILCVGDITWTNNITSGTATNTDFLTDNGIPVFTATTETVVYRITHTIPSGTFSATASSAIAGCKFKELTSGDVLQFEILNASESSGLLDFNNSGLSVYAKLNTFTALTAEPTEFVIQTEDNNVEIYGAGVMVN